MLKNEKTPKVLVVYIAFSYFELRSEVVKRYSWGLLEICKAQATRTELVVLVGVTYSDENHRTYHEMVQNMLPWRR